MKLKFDNTYCCNINGTIVPDYSNYTKEELAGEIVRLREENKKLNKQLKQLSETFTEATIKYIHFMNEVDQQLKLPFWRRSKVALPYYYVDVGR